MRNTIYTSFLALVLVTLLSCESKKATSSAYSSADLDESNKITSTYSFSPDVALPDACTLLSRESVAKEFGVELIYVNVIDGNPQGEESRSCFFKWDDPNYPNAGILIQIQSNPMVEEVPDWPAYAVANKRTTGETIMGDAAPTIYKMWPGVGTDASYSYELGKYYWRIKNDLLVMLAYNMDITEDKQKETAYAIAQEVMDNLSAHGGK